jgi:hypothetical protein
LYIHFPPGPFPASVPRPESAIRPALTGNRVDTVGTGEMELFGRLPVAALCADSGDIAELIASLLRTRYCSLYRQMI